jgi:DNA-binding Xre family transcriptional regulator
MGPLNKLVDEALRQLEKEALDRGEEWNVKQLEIDHGLSNGILSKLRKGRRSGVLLDTLPKLAAALKVPHDDLVAARQGRPVKLRLVSPAPSPTPAPSSAVVSTVVSDDATDEVIALAMKGTGFPYEAGAAVRPLVRDRAALIGPDDDPVLIVRAWIETAYELQLRGRAATPAAIFGELSHYRSVHAGRRSAEANAKTDAELAAQGITPPAEPPPAVQKARERREKRRERE